MRKLIFVLFAAGVLCAFAEDHSAVLSVCNHTGAPIGDTLLQLADTLAVKVRGSGVSVVNVSNRVISEAEAIDIAREHGADSLLTAAIVSVDRETVIEDSIYRLVVSATLNLQDVESLKSLAGADVEVVSENITAQQLKRNQSLIYHRIMKKVAEEASKRLVAELDGVVWPQRSRAKAPCRKEPIVLLTPPPVRPTVVAPLQKKPITDKRLTVADMDGAIVALGTAMLTDSGFRSNYASVTNRIAESGEGRLPVAVIGGLTDLTKGAAHAELVDSAHATERVVLFKSKLFDIKDDTIIAALTKRILASGNSPLEDGEVMSALKRHGSPDFFVVGDLREFGGVDGIKYRLRLALHDLATGKVVWEGFHDIEK